MLSRTADNLFWLARYMERAENMARLIDMGRRISATPIGAEGVRRNEWPSILAAAGVAETYRFATGADPAETTQSKVAPFLVTSPDNPSSVTSCFEAARSNARAARAALTREMWEAVNDAWIEFRALKPEHLQNGSMSPLLDRVKAAATLFRGAFDSSAIRNDGYAFLRLGFSIERMDNVARLLDAKCMMSGDAANHPDYLALMAILRAVGMERAYRAVYPADYAMAHVFDFLVRNSECPRSLRACAEESRRRLDDLATLYDSRRPSGATAQSLCALTTANLDPSSDPSAAHAALSAIIRLNNLLSAQIAEDFYFAPRREAPESKTDDEAASKPESGSSIEQRAN